MVAAAPRIRTAIVIETLPRGRWLAWPFADADLTQLGGPGDDPALIMSLVLPEHLKTLPGSALARFATPPGTELGTTTVDLVRPDRKARIGREPERLTLALPWVTTPYGKELWLHLPSLRLTLRLDDPAERDTIVRQEVARLVAATEPSADDLLRLFPALAYRLEWIDVTLEHEARKTRSRAEAAKRIAQEEAHALLSTVASPMHADRRVLEGAPLVGRPGDLETLDRLLAKESVLVQGPELAGKTALIEGWLRARLASPEPRAADALPPVLMYASSGARLMAGMSLLGQWQERLRRVLQALATLEAVLWIEHLGELLGDATQGDELANALRPWLEDGRVRLVTELRDGEVDRMERRFPALMGTLRRVRLGALDAATTAQVLEARRRHLAELEPDRPRLAAAALPELIGLAGRYQSHLALPGVAVRLGEDLRALADAERTREGRAPELDAADLQRLYATLTGLPVWLLEDRRAYDREATEALLKKQVIGQDAAVRAVAEALAVIKTRLAARGKPLASFLFAGPTGVGKTELARALAILLFGSEQRLARFDMSEFMDAAAAERLIRGAPAAEGGLKDGLLTRRLRREPLSVVLLDEIEKAHASVFDLLLQALGEGRLTDATGRTASLEGCIVILTSNIGSADKVKRIGLVAADGDSLAQHYLAAVRRHFAPEMVNRLERIIPFASLGAEPLRRIVRLQVERVRRRRGLDGIELNVSDAALDHLAAAGTTAEYGARALRRAVEKLFTTPLAHAIANVPARRVMRVDVDLAARMSGPVVVAGELGLQLFEVARTSANDPLTSVARLRREARAYLVSASLREVKDRLEHLDAELLRGAPAAALLAERARLEALLSPFRETTEEVEQLEDILYMSPPPAGSIAPEIAAELEWAEARVEDLATAAFEVLTAIEQRRDRALVALTELDDHRGFDRWLVPLLEEAEQRRWTVQAWIEGERGADGERWPGDLGFGPPRALDDLYLRLQERPSSFRHLLLGVAGRHAGTLLACEAGVIALRPSGGDHAHVHVKVLSTMRATIDVEGLRESALIAAPAPETRGPLSHGTAARIFTTAPERVTVAALGTATHHDGDPARYFAAWERHAARHIRTWDESLEHDRSDLFTSPFDEEAILRRLMREALERPDLFDSH